MREQKKGLEIIKAAADAGYIALETQDNNLLPLSQPNLLKTRGALWGRLSVLRLLGVRTPTFSGFNLFSLWSTELSFSETLKSIAGTIKRIHKKKLRHKISLSEYK